MAGRRPAARDGPTLCTYRNVKGMWRHEGAALPRTEHKLLAAILAVVASAKISTRPGAIPDDRGYGRGCRSSYSVAPEGTVSISSAPEMGSSLKKMGFGFGDLDLDHRFAATGSWPWRPTRSNAARHTEVVRRLTGDGRDRRDGGATGPLVPGTSSGGGGPEGPHDAPSTWSGTV
jgi:hypothetical protein